MDRLITFKDPTIQSFDLHQIAREPVDLTDNRMPIMFQIRGTGDNKTNFVDPRASSLSIQSRKAKKGEIYSSRKNTFGKCDQRHRYNLELDEQFAPLIVRLLCLEPAVKLNGTRGESNKSFLQIWIRKCDANLLH